MCTLIVGPSGVGKSHLAQALGQEACGRGYDVLSVAVSKLLAHLHGGRADNSFEKRLTGYLRCDLLILDDFGLRRLKPQEAEDLYEVINARYERGSVMVTSNRDYDEWPEAFGDNALLASATLDRLAHRAHLITITGQELPGPRPTQAAGQGGTTSLRAESPGTPGDELGYPCVCHQFL